jgi:RNA polymerase sigma-70 factor (ECF subfamily)
MTAGDPGRADNVQQWIDAARGGSKEAMGELMQVCRQYLLGVANRELETALQAKVGASDLVQETFLDAQRDFPQFHGNTETELLAWFRSILLHNLLGHARQYRNTGKRRLDLEVPIQPGESGLDLSGLLIADATSPSNRAIQKEEAEALERALERLPEQYRQVILLKQRERLPLEEIGRLMDRSPDAVRKLWSRAIERLAEELGLHHDG